MINFNDWIMQLKLEENKINPWHRRRCTIVKSFSKSFLCHYPPKKKTKKLCIYRYEKYSSVSLDIVFLKCRKIYTWKNNLNGNNSLIAGRKKTNKTNSPKARQVSYLNHYNEQTRPCLRNYGHRYRTWVIASNQATGKSFAIHEIYILNLHCSYNYSVARKCAISL